MKSVSQRRILSVIALAASGATSAAWGDILYSNMQGNVVAEQTSSVTINKGYYDTSGVYHNDDPDPNQTQTSFSAGIGDDYQLGYNGVSMTQYGIVDRYVEMNSITVYGGASPQAGNPLGSLGTSTTVYVFNSQKQFLPRTINIISQFQGIGSHTFTFSNVWIPTNGYIFFVPNAFRTVNVGTGVSTPYSYGTISYTGVFGAAPTIGLGDGGAFASINSSRQFNNPPNPAQPNSPAYMQIALGGTGTGGMLCDANGDNIVNALDFNALATHFGTGSGAVLTQGDFNFDGAVNSADFSLLAMTFNRRLPQPASPLSTLVPEPSAALALGAAFIAVRGRRRAVSQQK